MESWCRAQLPHLCSRVMMHGNPSNKSFLLMCNLYVYANKHIFLCCIEIYIYICIYIYIKMIRLGDSLQSFSSFLHKSHPLLVSKLHPFYHPSNHTRPFLNLRSDLSDPKLRWFKIPDLHLAEGLLGSWKLVILQVYWLITNKKSS